MLTYSLSARFLVGLCPADISLNHEHHQKSVRNERAACSGTMQITKGLGIPNKHFAKQKGRLYRQTPCLQKVDLKITERENRRVDFVRG